MADSPPFNISVALPFLKSRNTDSGMSKRESRTLQSTSEVMSALGDEAGVSRLTGARYKVVWQWRADGQFPSKYHAVMTWALRRKGLRAHPSLWGQITIPEMDKAA